MYITERLSESQSETVHIGKEYRHFVESKMHVTGIIRFEDDTTQIESWS